MFARIALAVGIVVLTLPYPAALVSAATPAATVGNGLTTTDLTAPTMSPQALASALVGPGVTVSNVTYTGALSQAGLIHLVDPAVVSFNDGVILSSGNIADVVGPNKSDSITGYMAGPADADLNLLIANTQTVLPMTFDAASLEFDFVPTASQVYFTYTFGSDEYLEWVNLFNDVFAFYVNGNNCATVPGGAPISIDTINNAVNPDLFRDNSFTNPPVNPINIESDGLSVELICAASVNVGQVNHMKLVIADTSDPILDSVVIIKSHSLSTTKPESCNDSRDNDDDGLIDMDDDYCTATTVPPPTGSSGIGSSGSAPAFTGNEGAPIVFDATAVGWSAAAGTLTTSWTVTGINGTVGSCEVTPAGKLPLAADGSIAGVTAICPNEGEFVASVHGWDVENKSSFDKDVDFFVHNAPPSVTIETPAVGTLVDVGTPLALSAVVIDPGINDTVSCSISWGDGASEPGTLVSGICTGSHTYASVGSYIVSLTGTDDAGDSSAAATVVEVTTAGPPVDPTPAISGFSPASGPVGTPVTITGTDLASATSVTFNGTAATTFSVVSATQITATVPVGATTGTVAVTTAGGTATSANPFTVTVAAPTITGFSPASGPVGTLVTITGTDLTGATSITFNGTAATTFAVVSATQITATVPSGATTGKVSVTTAGGTATSANAFTVTVKAPTITGFSPASGPVGTSVTITGANLDGATSVAFNGKAATFTVTSSTSVVAIVPAGAKTGRITVTTAGGTAKSKKNFTVK